MTQAIAEKPDTLSQPNGDNLCGGCGGSGEDQNPLNDPGPCPVCGGELTWRHDHQPDNTGLDDGPPLLDVRQRRYPKKSPDESRAIRARAWETRRAKYGQHGHR